METKPKLERSLLGLTLGALVAFVASAVSAQEEPTRAWGSVGVVQRFIDESGSQNLFRERSDRFEGFGLNDVSLHVLTPHNFQVDLDAPRIDDVGHDVRFGVRNRFIRGAVHSAESRFIYDADGDLSSRRNRLTGELSIRPWQQVEFFGSHNRLDKSGARQSIVPGDEGELGTNFDQQSVSWRGGVRVSGLRSSVQVGLMERQFENRTNADFDRTTHGVDVLFRSRPSKRLSGQGMYGRQLTRLDRDGTKLEADRFSGRLNVYAHDGISVGPLLRIEQTTDEALGITSKIWALGTGIRRDGKLWRATIEGEWGQRDNGRAESDVWGIRASGSLDLTRGFWLDLRAQRFERERQGLEGIDPTGTVLPTIVGNLETQRVQTRLRYRAQELWSAEVTVARFDKNYDDVQVEQETWRYGVQASVTPRQNLRLDAGWRLDDASDDRTTGRYDLRTNTFFGGVQLDLAQRLHVHLRGDLLDLQRDLDVRKSLLTAGVDLDIQEDLRLGIVYENDEYEDGGVGGEDYNADVLLLTLRRGFNL